MTGSAWSGSKLCSLFAEHWNCGKIAGYQTESTGDWSCWRFQCTMKASGLLNIQPLWAEEVSVLYVSVLYPIKFNGVDSMLWRLYEHKIFLTEHLTSYFSAQESSRPSVQTLLILEKSIGDSHLKAKTNEEPWRVQLISKACFLPWSALWAEWIFINHLYGLPALLELQFCSIHRL